MCRHRQRHRRHREQISRHRCVRRLINRLLNPSTPYPSTRLRRCRQRPSTSNQRRSRRSTSGCARSAASRLRSTSSPGARRRPGAQSASALELAQLLRDEESARLEGTLEQEREARSAELRKRLEERERKLAQELSEIRTATEQRRQDEQAQAQRDAAARALSDDYRARISAKIRQRVILPPDLQGNPEAIYAVSLLPGGTVTEVRLLKTSGVSTYDAAVERAILAAQPLPVPEEPGLIPRAELGEDRLELPERIF